MDVGEQIGITADEVILTRVNEALVMVGAAAAETEIERRLSHEVIAALRDDGVFRVLSPRTWGGSALGVSTFVEITRALARVDLSTAWVVSFFMEHVWQVSRFSLEAQNDVFEERPEALLAGSGAPPGVATIVPGGLRISGRWGYCSGVMHSEWLILLAITEAQERFWCLVPVVDVVVHDVWNMSGMRGTGSNDVEAADLFVPTHRTIDFELFMGSDNPGAAVHDYPLLRLPVHRLVQLVQPALLVGAAEGALELFKQNVRTRRRSFTGAPMGAAAATQIRFAEAAHAVRSADLALRSIVDTLEAMIDKNRFDELTLEDRAMLNLLNAGAGVMAGKAIDDLCEGAGASMFRAGNALDRIGRDSRVVRNHPVMDWDFTREFAGRALFGMDMPEIPAGFF